MSFHVTPLWQHRCTEMLYYTFFLITMNSTNKTDKQLIFQNLGSWPLQNYLFSLTKRSHNNSIIIWHRFCLEAAVDFCEHPSFLSLIWTFYVQYQTPPFLRSHVKYKRACASSMEVIQPVLYCVNWACPTVPHGCPKNQSGIAFTLKFPLLILSRLQEMPNHQLPENL